VDTNKNYYAILGVLPTAEFIIIRAAYKALAQRYHPDRYQGDASEANRLMADINEAYQILSDPELRVRYDDLRGDRTQDAGSFFENDPVEDSIGDPLLQQWAIAVEYYPDLERLEKDLSKTSRRLAYTFKAYMLESKDFDKRVAIADEMARNFLTIYFGENPKIVGFAKYLIAHGEREAARSLNQAIRVLGTNPDPNIIINRISKKYQLQGHHQRNERNELLNAFLWGDWAMAKSLLEKGVSPFGITDEKGRSLFEIANNRKDSLMLGLLHDFMPETSSH